MKIGVVSKNTEKQIQQLKQQTEEYRHAHSQFLGGQSIEALRRQAEIKVEQAKKEALQILASARDKLNGIDEARAAISAKEADLDKREKEIARKESEIDRIHQESVLADSKKGAELIALQTARKEAEIEKESYLNKTESLKKALNDLARTFG